MSQNLKLDKERLRDLFDLRRRGEGGNSVYVDDPNPAYHRLRRTGPVHQGIVHELLGFDGPAVFQGLPFPDRPHFSAFSYLTCNEILRDERTFAKWHVEVRGDEGVGIDSSMMNMGEARHRRYRALVQPSFALQKATWWIQRWISENVEALIDGFAGDGRAELNVDFNAAIPLLTITGSFGVDVDDALDIRASLERSACEPADTLSTLQRILMPIIADRRTSPRDDLISVLCGSQLSDEGGTHSLSDSEIFSFAHFLFATGTGTTWKQLGITLAALLSHPEILERVRRDRDLLRPAIEESLRWAPTDPMFSRFVTEDIEFHGVTLKKESVVHACLGAANRDPTRWLNPNEYDIDRPPTPNLGFGAGPRTCLGMHVARAEMFIAINTLLDRLPNLRLDPGADTPRIIGMYERGPTELRVIWD